MTCDICHKEPEMYWKDKEHKNGHSETFYTNTKGQTVCASCLTGKEVSSFKGLHDLNNERKQSR